MKDVGFRQQGFGWLTVRWSKASVEPGPISLVLVLPDALVDLTILTRTRASLRLADLPSLVFPFPTSFTAQRFPQTLVVRYAVPAIIYQGRSKKGRHGKIGKNFQSNLGWEELWPICQCGRKDDYTESTRRTPMISTLRSRVTWRWTFAMYERGSDDRSS